MSNKSNKPKLLSLFSGCGGLDLGFLQAGYEIVWANDNEHWSCETYKKNFGDHIHEGSIVDVDFSKVPDCDIITGGFPCQDFSVTSKRGGLETDRGNLYKQFVRAVDEKRPKVFIAENVKGLLSANKGRAIGTSCIFQDVVFGDIDAPCKGTYDCYRPSGTYGVLSTSDSSFLPAYKARIGYDLATGIGSVNAYNLAKNW